MRLRIMKGLLALGFAGACCTGPALAQNREKAWEIFPYVGYAFYASPKLGDSIRVQSDFPVGFNTISTVTSTIDDTYSFGLRFGYHWTKHQEAEFGFGGHSTTGDILLNKKVVDRTDPTNVTSDVDKGETLSIDFIVAHANYTYNFFLHRRDKIVAYVSGGVGVIDTSLFGQTADPDLVPILDELIGDEANLMYNYGVGIRFFGGRRAGIRLDVRRFDYSAERGDQNYLEVGLGVTIVVGGA